MMNRHLYFSVGALAASLTAFHAVTMQPNGSALPALTLKQAREIETANSLPIPKLYDMPLESGKPGTLIAAEECSAYRFPATPEIRPEDTGIRAVRFLYHSRSATGRPVPATGVILVPYGPPPQEGWPVVVWAHGTSGVGRRFAPSLMKNLYYGWASPISWAMLGYAVVAPDYAGLGSRVPHQYLALDAQAQDVIYSVTAARP